MIDSSLPRTGLPFQGKLVQKLPPPAISHPHATREPRKITSVSNSNEVIMHLFEIVGTDVVYAAVLAEGFDEAAALFSAWHLANRDAPLPDFEVRQRNPQCSGINTEQALEALAREMPGIDRYDPSKGWAIGSPFDLREG